MPSALPRCLRCVCDHGHITLYPAAERGHIPADCPDCGGHIVHLADAAHYAEPGLAPVVALPVAAALPSEAQRLADALCEDWRAEQIEQAKRAREDRRWKWATWILAALFLAVFWRGLLGLAQMALHALGVL